jgi:hypothetical protein
MDPHWFGALDPDLYWNQCELETLTFTQFSTLYNFFVFVDIESEKDFPPEYLSNVTRKEETCRAQIARIGRPSRYNDTLSNVNLPFLAWFFFFVLIVCRPVNVSYFNLRYSSDVKAPIESICF